MMRQILKQMVGALATPLIMAVLIAIFAGICRMRGRRRASAWLLALAAGIVYLGALRPIGEALLAPLEQFYPPLTDDARLTGVSAIVVLGSGYAPRDGIPVT